MRSPSRELASARRQIGCAPAGRELVLVARFCCLTFGLRSTTYRALKLKVRLRLHSCSLSSVELELISRSSLSVVVSLAGLSPQSNEIHNVPCSEAKVVSLAVNDGSRSI